MVFVLARKDAKNNERERERERDDAPTPAPSNPILSLFGARKSRDGSSFPSTSYSSSCSSECLVKECLVKEITENKGKVPLWTSRLKRVEYYIHSLSLSFL